MNKTAMRANTLVRRCLVPLLNATINVSGICDGSKKSANKDFLTATF